MTNANPDEVLVAESDGVTVEKSFEPDDFPVPAIAFALRSDRDEAVTVRLVDTVPEDVSPENIGFHPKYGAEFWDVSGDDIVFERELAPGEEYTTVYGLRGDDADVPSKFMSDPRIKSVSPHLGGGIDDGTDHLDDGTDNGTEDDTGASTDAESDTDTEGIESDTDTEDIELGGDAEDIESDTDAEDIESDTDAEDIESDTDAEDIESDTDAEDIESDTDAEDIESDTDTEDIELGGDTEDIESDTDAEDIEPGGEDMESGADDAEPDVDGSETTGVTESGTDDVGADTDGADPDATEIDSDTGDDADTETGIDTDLPGNGRNEPTRTNLDANRSGEDSLLSELIDEIEDADPDDPQNRRAPGRARDRSDQGDRRGADRSPPVRGVRSRSVYRRARSIP